MTKKKSTTKATRKKAVKASTGKRPFEIIREYIAKHPDTPRKEALAALAALGINAGTAKTQLFKMRRALAEG